MFRQGLLIALLASLSGGCQKPSAPESSAGGVQATAAPTGVNTAVAATGEQRSRTDKAGQHARDEVWTDANGQKWLGNVPFDAFFDQPYAVASDQTPIAGAAPLTLPGTTPATPDSNAAGSGQAMVANSAGADSPTSTPPTSGTSPENSATVAAGAPGWDELITAEALDEEVKAIRNFLNENLQSVGTFNSSMLMIPPKAAALAALAEVAAKHPQKVSWKDDAAYVRDLAKQMNSAPLQRGAKDQKRLLELYEAISDTLNRSRPAGLTEPPAGDSFAEAAEMRLLMMRMEEAEKRMRTEAGSEASFGSKKPLVQQEASVMAALARIVTDPGYGYSDDPEFTGYGNDIVQAALSIRIAGEGGDFASYEAGLSKIATTCQNCHSKYKND